MGTSGPREAGRDVPPKATLFCPDCDHQSRVDGDWHVVETARNIRYLCPDCGTEITVRPTLSSRKRHHSPAVV